MMIRWRRADEEEGMMLIKGQVVPETGPRKRKKCGCCVRAPGSGKARTKMELRLYLLGTGHT